MNVTKPAHTASFKKALTPAARPAASTTPRNLTADSTERTTPFAEAKGQGYNPEATTRPHTPSPTPAPTTAPHSSPSTKFEHHGPTSSGGGGNRPRAELLNDSVSFSSEAQNSHSDDDSFINPFDAWT